MSLSVFQRRATARELQANYELLAFSEERVLHDLRFSRDQLQRTLAVRGADPGDVWKLRDYLVEKLRGEGKEPLSFSALSDPSVNHWFTYERTWE